MKELLPIGSVVLLKNGIKKLMIIGIMPIFLEHPERRYDYIAVPYPEGFIGNEMNFLFKHEDITDVISRGYANSEWEEFLSLVEEENRKIDQLEMRPEESANA